MTREDRSVLGLPLALSSGLHLFVFALVVALLAARPAGLGQRPGRGDLVHATTTFSIQRRVAIVGVTRTHVTSRAALAPRPEPPVRLAAAERRVHTPHPALARREAVALQSRPQPAMQRAVVAAQRVAEAEAPEDAAQPQALVPTLAAPAVRSAQHPASNAAPAAANGAVAAIPTAVPLVTAAVARAPAEAGEPAGGWGQTFAKPLLADESVLTQLRAKYHIGAIVVHVDEAGHATQIDMAAGVSEEAHAEIERVLLSARFVPAECNGLRCEGALDLVV